METPIAPFLFSINLKQLFVCCKTGLDISGLQQPIEDSGTQDMVGLRGFPRLDIIQSLHFLLNSLII